MALGPSSGGPAAEKTRVGMMGQEERDALVETLTPVWPAPSNVHALTSTRRGGHSRPPFRGLNLAGHVGDDEGCVRANRAALRQALELPEEPRWLEQVHGTRVVDIARTPGPAVGDAGISTTPGVVCAVLTADCLPILMCDRSGSRVAAVHAGWRGLCAGVVEATLEAMATPPDRLLAWLGPAIGPRAYEVGDEVRDGFVRAAPAAARAFSPSANGRWLMNIYALARARLLECGVGYVGGGDLCTYEDAARFYSYRRDGTTGRMASLIWLTSHS